MLAQSQQFFARIQERRSVRDFADTPVDREIIDNAIRAAGSAPSGANKQPWHCLLYTSPSPRDLSTSRMPSSA